MGAILTLLMPVLIRAVAWILDYINAKDQIKKNFYLFVAQWEIDRGTSVRLAKSRREQIDRARKELQEGEVSAKPE